MSRSGASVKFPRLQFWILVLSATLWFSLATFLFIRGVNEQGFLVYLDSGNVSGALISLVLPGAFIAVAHHSAQVNLHRNTREHAERLHAETKETAERHHLALKQHLGAELARIEHKGVSADAKKPSD